METRANYAIVGFFTIVVILSAFGFVYWMTQFGTAGVTAPLVVRIPGSANGLSIGSPVRFNGIAIGTVRDLTIDRTNPDFVIAETEVRLDAPIFSDTTAALEIQGLTGSAYIELQGGTATEESILEKAIEDSTIAVIEADPSGVTNLLATADAILTRANRVIGEIEGFVVDVREPLTQTLRNAATFSDALSQNAEGIDEFLKSVSALSTTLRSVSGKLESTLTSADSLLKAVEPARIESIVANVDKFTSEVAGASDDITDTLIKIREAAAKFESFGENAGNTLDRVDALVAELDPQKVGKVVDNIALASSDARKALADVRSVAETFSAHTTDYDQIIADVKQMANRLNASSARVDGVLAKLDGFLGEGDASSLIDDAKETLAAFKEVADSLNKRIGPIAENLQRFSGAGLSNVESLVSEARRAIARIESSIAELESNPQRLLFGGETVKQYDGRARH